MAADLIQDTPEMFVPRGWKNLGDGSYALIVSSEDGGGSGGVDREIALVGYRVKTAFPGAALGDTLTSTRVIDVSGATPVQVGDTIWYNESTALPLANAPLAANIEPLASGGITNAQMAALLAGQATAALQTSTTGTKTDASAVLPAGGSGIIGWLSKLVTDVLALSAKLPASLGAKAGAGSLSIVPATDARMTVGSRYVQAITAVADGTDVRFMVGEFGQLMVQQMGVINGVAYNPQLLQDGTNRSGAIATANTAVVVAPQNTARRQLTGQNISNGDLWFREDGTAAVVGATGCYRVASGQAFAVSTNRAISVVGATVGQAWTATEV